MRSSYGWDVGLRTKFSAVVLPLVLTMFLGSPATQTTCAYGCAVDEDDFSTTEEARALQKRIIDVIEKTRFAVVVCGVLRDVPGELRDLEVLLQVLLKTVV